MFRNQYDTDCITWSPAGRIHQVEYAMEAVKQGSACIGLRSNSFALVATLKRSSSELSSYQKKIFKIDDNSAPPAASHAPLRPRRPARLHLPAPPPRPRVYCGRCFRSGHWHCGLGGGRAFAVQVHAHGVHQPPLRVRRADAGRPPRPPGRRQGADWHPAHRPPALRRWSPDCWFRPDRPPPL